MYKKPTPTVKSYSSKKSRKTEKPDKPQKTDAKSTTTAKSKRGRPRKLDDTKSVKSIKSTKTMRSTKTAKSTRTLRSMKSTKTAKSAKTTKSTKTAKTTKSTRKQTPRSKRAMSVKSAATDKPKRSYKRRRPPTPGPPKRKYVRKSINKDVSGSSGAAADISAMTAEPPSGVHRPIVVSSVPLKTPFKSNGIIVERRPSNGQPSAIKMRISYNKDTPPSFRASAFAAATANCKLTSTPLNGISRLNMSSGCANCSKYSGLNDSMLTNVSSHRSMLPMMSATGASCENREEFLKYLGIDTKPTQEKTTSPQTSPPDAAATATGVYNSRRSLRVFIQQKQNEYSRLSKSPDKSSSAVKTPPRIHYNGSAAAASGSANNVNASPSESMKRGCALNNDLRLGPSDLLLSSSSVSLPSLPITQSNGLVKPNSISSHIKQRHSYDPASMAKSLLTLQSSASMVATCSGPTTTAGAAPAVLNNGARKLTNDPSNSITKEAGAAAAAAPSNVMALRQSANDEIGSGGAGASATVKSPAPAASRRRDSLDRTRLLRTQKRKVILPSPMMLTEMFKRYKQCFRQGFAMQKQLRQQMKSIAKMPATDADTDALNQLTESMTDGQTAATNEHPHDDSRAETSFANAIETPDEELPDTLLSGHSSNVCTTISTPATLPASTLPTPAPPPPPPLPLPNITLSSSDSIQWNRDLAKRTDKVQFSSPLDRKHGAVLAILTHSVSPSEDDVVVVVQETQISYWYSTAKILCMFGIDRKWIPVSSIPRVNTGMLSGIFMLPFHT